MKKVIKFLGSLKLAVIVIILMAIVTAAGTIVEAMYDAYAAKKLVYDSVWMWSVMIAFAINLTAVMVDRWPWKAKHSAFVLAHIGILIMLFGAMLTLKFGLDGTMSIGIGQKNQFVTTSETDILVYSSFDGDGYTKLFESEVDFFSHPPSESKPFQIPADKGNIEIVEYKKYVIPSREVLVSEDQKDGAAIRFQIQNDRVNVIEWLVQKHKEDTAQYNFGPAQIYFGPAPEKGRSKNEIYLTQLKDLKKNSNNDKLQLTLFRKDSEFPVKKVVVSEGDTVDTGWMGLQLRILRFIPHSKEEWKVVEQERPTPMTTPAIKIRYQGKEHWALLNDMTKFFTDSAVFLVSYAHRRIDLGFNLKLHHFDVSKYQGTMRAMSYKSIVELPEGTQHEISMNEPLKYKGLTFYQASFQQDGPSGEPTASVFSVNFDPGRVFKYLGSIVMSLGIIMLFYFRKLYFKPSHLNKDEE